jgi:hypothetical protein
MAQVSWNRQLGLAVTLVGLGALAYWAQFKQKPQDDAKEAEAKKIFHLKDHQIESLVIRNSPSAETAAVPFTLKCLGFDKKLCKPGDNSQWELETPFKTKADSASVNSIVSTLNNLKMSDTIDLKDETPEKRAALLKEYGLDPASRQISRLVSVKSDNGSTTYYLGKTHPIGEGIFSVGESAPGKVDENQVFILPSSLKSSFEQSSSHWRDKKILDVQMHSLTAFQVDGSQGKFSADLKNGNWMLKTPKGEISGDLENTEGFLNGLTFLQAKQFASDSKTDAKAKTALKGAKHIVRVVLLGDPKVPAQRWQLDFFKKDGAPLKSVKGKNPKDHSQGPFQVFVTVSNQDPLYEVDPSSAGRFDKSPKDLRQSKIIAALERFNAKKIEFSGAGLGGSVTLSESGKPGDPWNMDVASGTTKSSSNGKVPRETVSKILEKISDAKIMDFIDDAKVPGGVPSGNTGLKFTLFDDKNQPKREVLFWKTPGTASGAGFFGKDLLSPRKESWKLDPVLSLGLPWDMKFFEKGESGKPTKQ